MAFITYLQTYMYISSADFFLSLSGETVVPDGKIGAESLLCGMLESINIKKNKIKQAAS